MLLQQLVLVLELVLLLPLLLRAAPQQCVTLIPGHVRPRWRIAISIVHRFLKKNRRGRERRTQLSSATNRPKGLIDFTMNFPLCATAAAAAAPLDFARDGGGDLDFVERGWGQWRARGEKRCAGRRGCGFGCMPLWAWALWM